MELIASTIPNSSNPAGWYVTKNIMAKAEYVTQSYNGFKSSDIRNGGKFDGIALQAVVGF